MSQPFSGENTNSSLSRVSIIIRSPPGVSATPVPVGMVGRIMRSTASHWPEEDSTTSWTDESSTRSARTSTYRDPRSPLQ
eukprot:scaffold120907_cov38-Prasinocladus_malaysianus.AAC.1